jgi:hypothetical protein
MSTGWESSAGRRNGRPQPECAFDAEGFFAARDELARSGYITETQVECGPYLGFEMFPTSRVPEYDFTVAEAEVLRYVAKTYLSTTARDLCEDIVYRTEPMQGLEMGDAVPMDQVNRDPKDRLGFGVERMLAGEVAAEAGRTRPLADVLHELRARDH